MGAVTVSSQSVKDRRTPWMTAIGILDIIIGAFGVVLNGFLLYGATEIRRATETAVTSLQSTSERQFFAAEAMQLATQAEEEFYEAKAYIQLDLSFNLLLTASLIVIGIATLRLKPWARFCSIGWSLVCIGWLVFISIIEPVDFDKWGLLIYLYPATLLFLFSRREWKGVFTSHPVRS